MEFALSVPFSGFGTPKDVRSFDGPKSVTISSTSSGRHVIHGSIDGASYTPMLVFYEGESNRLKIFISQVTFVRVERISSNDRRPTIVIGGVSGAPLDDDRSLLAKRSFP